MNLPEHALLKPESITLIPAELVAQATALAKAAEALEGLGLVILFDVPGHDGPGLPLFLVGDSKATARRMLASAMGLCQVLGIAEVQPMACNCPKCRAARAKSGQA